VTSSENARRVVVEALRLEGEPVDERTVYAVQALARSDGGYGNFRSPPHGPEGPTSNNWGAVQHPELPANIIWRGSQNPDRSSPEVQALLSVPAPPSPHPSRWFYASDFDKRPGKGWFWGPYRVYSSPQEGARHVVRLMARMGALDAARNEGTWDAVSRALYAGHYYGGTSQDDETNIERYAQFLRGSGEAIAQDLDSVDPLGEGGDEPPVEWKRRIVAALTLGAMTGLAWWAIRRRWQS